MVHDRSRADAVFEAEPVDSKWAHAMETRVERHVVGLVPPRARSRACVEREVPRSPYASMTRDHARARVDAYGTIGLLRSIEVPAPTISVCAWFACWQTYSNSSVPFSQRRFDVPVKGAV